jgi:TPR repeat protein
MRLLSVLAIVRRSAMLGSFVLVAHGVALAARPVGSAPVPVGSALAQPAYVTACDILTAHPDDTTRTADPVPFNERDAARAVPACEEAVRQHPNQPRLRYQLGLANDSARRYAESFSHYRQAANSDYTAAGFALGWAYANGEGTPRDDSAAIRWYQWAAERGHSAAQNTLGFMYENGRGVTPSLSQAADWYRRAYEQGRPIAAANYGRMLALGYGGPVGTSPAMRRTLAVTVLREAVRQDRPDAALQLALMAERREVQIDRSELIHLWALAEARSSERDRARRSLDRLAAQGAPAEIERARAAIAQRQTVMDNERSRARELREAALRQATLAAGQAPPSQSSIGGPLSSPAGRTTGSSPSSLASRADNAGSMPSQSSERPASIMTAASFMAHLQPYIGTCLPAMELTEFNRFEGVTRSDNIKRQNLQSQQTNCPIKVHSEGLSIALTGRLSDRLVEISEEPRIEGNRVLFYSATSLTPIDDNAAKIITKYNIPVDSARCVQKLFHEEFKGNAYLILSNFLCAQDDQVRAISFTFIAQHISFVQNRYVCIGSNTPQGYCEQINIVLQIPYKLSGRVGNTPSTYASSTLIYWSKLAGFAVGLILLAVAFKRWRATLRKRSQQPRMPPAFGPAIPTANDATDGPLAEADLQSKALLENPGSGVSVSSHVNKMSDVTLSGQSQQAPSNMEKLGTLFAFLDGKFCGPVSLFISHLDEVTRAADSEFVIQDNCTVTASDVSKLLQIRILSRSPESSIIMEAEADRLGFVWREKKFISGFRIVGTNTVSSNVAHIISELPFVERDPNATLIVTGQAFQLVPLTRNRRIKDLATGFQLIGDNTISIEDYIQIQTLPNFSTNGRASVKIRNENQGERKRHSDWLIIVRNVSPIILIAFGYFAYAGFPDWTQPSSSSTARYQQPHNSRQSDITRKCTYWHSLLTSWVSSGVSGDVRTSLRIANEINAEEIRNRSGGGILTLEFHQMISGADVQFSFMSSRGSGFNSNWVRQNLVNGGFMRRCAQDLVPFYTNPRGR